MNGQVRPQNNDASAAESVYVPVWIKVTCDLACKAEVLAMARALQVPKATVVGGLVGVWVWFNRHTIDGTCRPLTLDDIDAFAGVAGLAPAMEEVGWLLHDLATQTISLPNFHRHSYRTEKRRLDQSKDRSRRYRARRRAPPDADSAPAPAARHVTETSPPRAREDTSSPMTARPPVPGAAESINEIEQIFAQGAPRNAAGHATAAQSRVTTEEVRT